MRHLRRHPLVSVCLLTLVALLLTLGFLLRSEDVPAAPEESTEAAAKVVRELPGKRQVYSTRYLLDNGQFRTVFSQAPVHYKDSEGDFQPVDLTLKATADGRYEASAAPLVVSFGEGSEESAPITVSGKEGTVSMELEGAAASVVSVEGAEARYSEVLPGVDVRYETLGDGLKETLVLASSAAPNSYTYRLTHAGFTLKQDEVGEWGLFKAKAMQPAFRLGGISVWDSSSDEGEMPAFCDSARLVVEPGKGESSITYTVPQKWLDDEMRVYPVEIDPSLFTRNPTDTYISPGYPNTCYGSSTALLAGKVSVATGYTRTLVKFPQLDNENNLPDNAHIAEATFSIRQYWQPTTNHDRTHVYRIGLASTLWGEGGTWNTITLSDSVEISPNSFSPSGSTWLNVSCAGVVQYWATRADSYNKGFQIRSKSTEGSTYARKFRSGEYSNPDYRPKLTVDWERPSMDSSADQASYEVGETVTVTVDLGSEDSPYMLENADQVTTVKMGVNRTDASSANRRGVFGWFDTPPTGAGWVHERARNESDELDGYFAYYSSTNYGSQHMTPLLSECEIADDHESLSFTFAVKESWGTVDDNQMDTSLEMRSGSNTWSSGWVSQTADTFDVSEAAGVPQALMSLSSTTSATTAWFTGTTNDTSDEGRGTVTLDWPAVPLADSYKVYLWDGVKYNLLTPTPITTTTWTTPTDIFPTDTQIAALAVDYTGNPYYRTNGRKLRDNPNLLYQKMAGSTNKDTDYRFKVVPHNNSHNGTGIDADIDDCAPLRVTLDNRTVTDNEDPQHADYELEGWNEHDFGAELDSGTLTSWVTDLAIASYGPSATLSRSYRSDESSAGLYAPGWFFNFEQSLDIGASEITYTDPERREHIFTGSGSSWSAPNGFLASLAPDSTDWELAYFDQTTLTFNSSGNLISESDANGNETSYAWASGKLTTITAENGQEIDLTYSGAKLSSASYETADGTRSITYATSSPWSLTRYPSSSCESELTYAYASDRLASITQEDWPTASNSVALTFTYTSGNLTEIRFPDYHATNKPDARATIAYDGDEATIQRYGTVSGTANQAMNREVLSWRGSGAGIPNQLTSLVSGSGGSAVTYTYNYAFDRQMATTTDSEGGQTNATINTDHDLTSETQTTGSLASANQMTTYAYDSQHRVTSQTSYQSPSVYATTTNTYTGASLTAVETEDQDETVLSASSYTYDSGGRRIQEKQLVSGTPDSGTWTQTDYSNSAASGEPGTTVAQDVELSVGAAQDLTKTKTYDDFGNLLTEKDWSNSRTVSINTYDIAGRVLTRTDAASVVTNTSYDCMGNETGSHRMASGTQKKADWSVTTYDAMGRALTITAKLSDASGSPTTANVVTNTYDGSGNELTVDDSALGGQNAKTLYDAKAEATEEWAEGVANYSDTGRSTRSIYDAEGNVTYESEPGNTNAPGSSATCTASTYDDAGNTLSQEQPDGSKTLSAYDGQGNEVQTAGEPTATGEFSPWDAASAYDASGQAVGVTDPQQGHEGLETASDLDLLGRTTETQAERDGVAIEPETTTTYNDLGWVLHSVDANGVMISRTYDTHGAVTSESLGGETTTAAYNATTGRPISRTDDDDTVVTYTYDAFGNVTRELHEASDSTDLKDINTTYDSLGRPTDIDEDVAGSERDFTYPQNTASGVQETIDYGASPAPSVAVTRNGRNMETSRVATIAASTTVTRSITDSSGRDSADRWTTASIQKSGRSAATQTRSFDAAGRYAAQAGLGLSSAGSYTYDANSGRKTAVTLPLALGGSITDSFDYYPGGRLAGADTNDVGATYAFDEVGNLVSDAVADVGTTSFTYDDDGSNRLERSAFLADYEGATAETIYYGFDETRGQRDCQGPTENPTTSTAPIVYAYNALGRMSSYDNSDTDTEASYTYDASGQRTKSVVTVDATTTTTELAYDGLTLMCLSATQGSSTWRVDCFYDEEGTPYGGLYRTPSSSSSPTYFSILTNDHGDVLELCDADGDAFASYRYDAWGLPQGDGSYATGIWTQSTDLVGSSLANDIASRQILRYAGYAYDAESGLYYCSARYYDPLTRQWTSVDPAKADGEESAYQYCGGEPVGYTDPSGELRRSFYLKLKVQKNTGRIYLGHMYAKGYIKYEHSGKFWKIARVEWNDYEGRACLSGSAWFSTHAHVKIQERRSRRVNAWITVRHKGWTYHTATRVAGYWYVNTPWVWKLKKPTLSRKSWKNSGWRSPATRVLVHQNLRLANDNGWGGLVFKGYFRGAPKLYL